MKKNNILPKTRLALFLLLVVNGWSCKETDKERLVFDDGTIIKYLEVKGRPVSQQGCTTVYFLQNHDCSCFEDQLKLVERRLKSPKESDCERILVADREPNKILDRLAQLSRVDTIISSYQDLTQHGIIMTSNKILTYQDGVLIDLLDLKKKN